MDPAIIAALIAAGGNILSNVGNSHLAQNAQNDYMRDWGGPQAQIQNMIHAGINPHAAAGKITGAAGDSPVGANMTSEGLGSMLSQLFDSHINPTVKDNTKSETRDNNATAEGKELENEVTSETMDEKKEQVRQYLQGTKLDNSIKEFTVEHQQEMYDLNKNEINSRIDLAEKQKEYYDQQITNLKKQVDVWDEEIKKIQQEIRTAISVEDLNRAQERLTNTMNQKAQVEKKILDIEEERMKGGTDKVDPFAQYFLSRTKELVEGGMSEEEAKSRARSEINEAMDVVKEYHANVSRGTVIGSDPWVAEKWRVYDNVRTKTEAIEFMESCLQEMIELQGRYALNVKTNPTPEEKAQQDEDMAEMQKYVDNLRISIDQLKGDRSISDKDFQRMNEAEGKMSPQRRLLFNGIESFIDGAIKFGVYGGSAYIHGRQMNKKAAADAKQKSVDDLGKKLSTGMPTVNVTDYNPTVTPSEVIKYQNYYNPIYK